MPEAVHTLSGGEVKDLAENEHQHRVLVDGRAYNSYTELADAFKPDIRNYAIIEDNR